MYTDTVTLFNYSKAEQGAYWYCTVLNDVELQITKGSFVAKTGNESVDSCVLHVKHLFTNKTYVKPKEFALLFDKQNNYTFSDKDFFVQGEYNLDIVNDTDYQGGFLNYMNKTYDDVFKVTKVDVFKLLPHLEVYGK
jgi:hypothetical protein